MIERNLGNVILPSSIKPEDKPILLAKLEKKKAQKVRGVHKMYQDLHNFGAICTDLSEGELTSLGNTLQRAGEGLRTLGFNDGQIQLPEGKNIILFKFSVPINDGHPDGMCGDDNEFLVVGVPLNMTIDDPMVKLAIFHETVHMITPTVYGVKKDKRGKHLERTAFGFTREFGWQSTKKHRVKGMVWEESLCDLFSLYCIDNYVDIKLRYGEEDCFMLALIDSFAKKMEIPPLEAFAKIFKGKIRYDFSVQKELAQAFGNKAIRRINNSNHKHKDYIQQLAEIAKIAGFYDTYLKFHEAMKTDGLTVSTVIPEIHGVIRFKNF